MTRTKKQGGTVRRLKSGRWQALIDTDGKRTSIGGTFHSEQAAHDALRERIVDQGRGTYRESRNAPFFEAYGRREVGLRDVRTSTRKGYESLLRRKLVPYFGHRRLTDISIGDVKVWWNVNSNRPVSRRNAYFLLRSMMSAAVDESLIGSNPCRIKDAGKDVAVKRPTWTVADFDAVLANSPEEYRPALEMLFAGHLRLGELIALNASDYDTATGVAHITKSDTGNTKTGQHKHIRILGRGINALAVHLAENPRIGNAPLFSGPKGGRLPRATLRNAWNNACQKAGRENFHLHDLRHVGLTEVARSGVSQKDVQTRGGHASMQAAMRYQHTDAERDAEVAALVDLRLAGLG